MVHITISKWMKEYLREVKKEIGKRKITVDLPNASIIELVNNKKNLWRYKKLEQHHILTSSQHLLRNNKKENQNIVFQLEHLSKYNIFKL